MLHTSNMFLCYISLIAHSANLLFIPQTYFCSYNIKITKSPFNFHLGVKNGLALWSQLFFSKKKIFCTINPQTWTKQWPPINYATFTCPAITVHGKWLAAITNGKWRKNNTHLQCQSSVDFLSSVKIANVQFPCWWLTWLVRCRLLSAGSGYRRRQKTHGQWATDSWHVRKQFFGN